MNAQKKKLHYRWVGKSEPKNCWQCGHRLLMPIRACDTGKELKKDWRCEVIGLENSIRYAVREGYICDKFAYLPKKNNMQDNIIVKKMEGFPEGVTFWEAFNKETGEIIEPIRENQ